MSLPLFLSRRIYSTQGDKRKVSRPAITIATTGVAIGLAVMIVSVSVVLGFKHTIRDKVVGFAGHIQVAEFMTLQTPETLPIQIGDSMMHVLRSFSGVSHVQRYTFKQGILKTDDDFLCVAFKGVGPEFDSTFLHKNMVEGSIPHFSDSKSSNRIVISRIMADKLHLKCGNRIFAYFIDNNGVRMRRFTVAGIYQTHLTQYDATVCYTDLYTAGKLNGWEKDQVTGAELTVKDFEKVNDTEQTIVKKVNRTIDDYGNTYTSKTIRDINPQIFSWLDLLDLNVWIILALMTAVAGVTMVSGLLIIILERTTMIGLLKAMGARNRTIRNTFLWFATFILGRGLLIGNIIGIGIVLIQQATGIITLDPASYYVSTVPVEFNLPFILLLNAGTLLVSLFVLLAPSFLISHIHPAKSMRYE